MLTPQDLNQIREVVHDVVHDVVHNEVQASENRIKAELRSEFVTKKEFMIEIRKVWKELRYLRKSINLVIEYFETEILEIRRRLKVAAL